MRREADFFGDLELVLVFVARRLKHALAVERVLDAAGLDYAVETGHYYSGILFPMERVGAYFYVAPEWESRARAALAEGGFRPYEP
jgi:hypothetical protein